MCNFKNIYKNGRLIKRQGKGGNERLSINYKFKKIKVDKKNLLLVKRQQWALLNDGNNRAFGILYKPIELGWA